MGMVTSSLSTTTVQDWQPGGPESNDAITRLCKQSNWALAAGGAWQWQLGTRIACTGTVTTGTQFWPVVCHPFSAPSLRISVFGQCSSGGTDQIGVYLSEGYPFGAGSQVATLTIPASPAVATCTVDCSLYLRPVLIYLRAETAIDDLELQGFRGRLVGAEPLDGALYNLSGFGVSRYIQEAEFSDNAPLTGQAINSQLSVAYSVKNLRGRGLYHASLSGGQVRNAEEITQASGGISQALWAGLPVRPAAYARAYVRSYQQASTGDDSLVIRLNGVSATLALATTGAQTQAVYEGWETLDLSPPGDNCLCDGIYVSDETAGCGHVIQDISIISGLFA